MELGFLVREIPLFERGIPMSAPASIASTQNSALHALHQHRSQGTSSSNAPSQLQTSFANLISSLNGSGASQAAGGTMQVNAVGGVSSTDTLDMASLIETMQAGSSSSSASSSAAGALQDLGQGSGVHGHHHHGAGQIGSTTDAGSTSGSSAVSAYSAMGGAAAPSAGISTHV